jgi:mRNA interferase MazF
MQKGEIWLINLDPTVGEEIKKTRPAIIISNNSIGKLPLKVIIPITHWKPIYSDVPWMVKLIPDTLNKLSKESAADAFQVRSVSERRFVRRIGLLSNPDISKILDALKIVFEID